MLAWEHPVLRAEFEKPTISVTLDEDAQRKVYGEAAAYVSSVAELRDLLGRVFANAETLRSWSRDLVAKQKVFLKEYLPETTLPSPVLCAQAVAGCVKRKREPAGVGL